MKRLMIALLLVVPLSAHAMSAKTVAKRLNTLVGQPVSVVVSLWGLPNSERTVLGMRAVSWYREAASYWNTWGVYPTCTITLTLAADMTITGAQAKAEPTGANSIGVPNPCGSFVKHKLFTQ